MWKVIFLGLLALIIAIAIFFWVKYFPSTKADSIGFYKSKSVNDVKPSGNVLGVGDDPSKNQINNFFNKTKDSLQKNSQNTIKSVTDQVYNQVQNTVNTVFDKSSPQSSVTVNILGDSSPPADSIIIDFLKDTSLKLNLKKGDKYHLQFKNIPANYCIYISNNKYQISDTQLIELQFNSNGTFPIRLNLCEMNDKNLGEITVQK